MAFTIPAAGAPFTDLTGRKCLIYPGSFRTLHRSRDEGARTERMRVVGDKLHYKGMPQRLFMSTLSAFANLNGSPKQIVEELKQRGHNFVRLTHIDQSSSDGILSGVGDWWNLDAAKKAAFIETIKAIRAAGMWYCLDFNSMAGNTAGSAITGANAAAIHAAATSIKGFKHLPPINAAADAQLKAYVSQLLAFDLGGGVTIANDPCFLYGTITNEHLIDEFFYAPFGTMDPDTQLALDAWKGSAWSGAVEADRRLYAAACTSYLSSFRAWMATQGCQAFVVWGSEFGTHRTEYDVVRGASDVKAVHLYCGVTGLVGEVLDPNEPSQQMSSVFNVKLANALHQLPMVSGPKIMEEYNSSDPNRYKAEAIPLGAIYAALYDWAGFGYFDWADGSWVAGDRPAIRQYQVSSDEHRDASIHLAASLYLRGDLNPLHLLTRTNYVFEDKAAKTWGVNTERTIAFAGPAGTSGFFQNGQRLRALTGHRALLFVTSFDRTPIREARRLLIGFLTDVQRRNRVFSDDFTAMTNAGAGNSCVWQATGDFSFYSPFPNKVTVYELGPDGQRGNAPALAINGNLVSFTADNSVVPWGLFEAECQGAPVLSRDGLLGRRRR